MNEFFIVLMFIVPALVVFAVIYFLMKSFFSHELKKRLMDSKIENMKLTTPIRLQAYERMALYLERISPNSLIFRVSQHGLSAQQLQSLLVQTIRDEFEHNLSQQVYVSSQAWELLKTAKEETIKLINAQANALPEDAIGNDLSRAIFEYCIQYNILPSDKALKYLKREVRELF